MERVHYFDLSGRKLKLSGFNQGRAVFRSRVVGFECRWDACFIRFLDGLLQTTGLCHADHQLRIPVRLREVLVHDPAPAVDVESSGESWLFCEDTDLT